ncbi:MAG: rod shape-determining protein MreC [Gammaproteobacteria bacterium]
MSSSIFKKSVTNFYLLLFLISLSILSIIVDLKYPSTNFTRTVVNDFIVSPIQYIVKTPSSFFYSLLEETKTIAQLESEIERLERDNKMMKMNLQKIDILEDEVSRLRSIKRIMSKKFENIQIARVIQGDVIPNKESIKINIGSNDKVIKGQTVMGANGLIGQIVEVALYSSKVLLITDVNSNVPAIITRTGKQVIIKGRSQDDLLEISFTDDTDIKSGDLIVTSGQAGRFIASLNIGRIVKIEMNEGERFAEVVVEPSEYIKNINEVIVTPDEYKDK